MFKQIIPAFLIAFLLPVFSDAQSLITYPIPDEVPQSKDFTVKVRKPGGQWKVISCYAPEVDMRNPRTASMTYFDFSGKVEVSVTSNRQAVKTARIRPLSYNLKPVVKGNVLTFTLDRPRNISVEVNDDIYHNLQLFAGPIESDVPSAQDTSVVYFGPGFHSPGNRLRVASNKTVYLAGGAVVKTHLLLSKVENVKIIGRGILYQGREGIEIGHSKNIEIDGITIFNPVHYTVHGGQSHNLIIRNMKAFSSKGNGDGIDLMSCTDVMVDGVFMRNSDDCIAVYNHRWNFWGGARNIIVRNSTLWADVAHPVNIGTHGNTPNPETMEDFLFSNIDILEHNEPQIDYQGCIAINVGDDNYARNFRFEDIRVEDFTQGTLVNLRVMNNKKYNTSPGRGIENIYFKNITYSGTRASTSILAGYDTVRGIKNVTFENLKINGRMIYETMRGKPGYYKTSDIAGFYTGEHLENVKFISTEK